jgi:putative ABC transport system substrate-binding protein
MLILSILSLPPVAEAQPSAKLPRIGYLGDPLGPYAPHFRQALRDLGYVEGQNIVIEYRWAEGRAEGLRDLVAELVQLQVDVLVTPGAQASRAAQQATSLIPIVVAHVGDPVGIGLVASLARPGGNITGVSGLAVATLGKQLELLKEAVPGSTRVAVLWNPLNPGGALWWKELHGASEVLGVTLHSVEVRGAEEFEKAFAALSPESADALFVIQDHLLFSHRIRIVDLAVQTRLPAVYGYREWVNLGGLMAYGASLREVYGRVAALVDKILKGAKPADLPVEQSMRLELVINLKAAQALGLTIPSTVLFRADEVIR